MSPQVPECIFKINEAESQYELHIGSKKAYLEYVHKDDKIYLTHTKVPKSLQGKGIGSLLVGKALEYLSQKNLTVMPLCSFVAHYIDNHPEFQSLLSDGYQM